MQDFIYFLRFRISQKYDMLCMESYGRIAPMAHTAFRGTQARPEIRNATCSSVPGPSPPETVRSAQEAAGMLPVRGDTPTNP